MTGLLVDAFKKSIFPYVVQIAVICFVFSVSQHAYGLFRNPNWHEFIEKFKSSVVAYAIVRGSFAIVDFLDKILGDL